MSNMTNIYEEEERKENERRSDTLNSLVGDLKELENILVRLYTRKRQVWGDMQPSYMTPKDLKGLLDRGIHLVSKIKEYSIPNDLNHLEQHNEKGSE